MKKIALAAQFLAIPKDDGTIEIRSIVCVGNQRIENFVKIEPDFETAMNTIKALQP